MHRCTRISPAPLPCRVGLPPSGGTPYRLGSSASQLLPGPHSASTPHTAHCPPPLPHSSSAFPRRHRLRSQHPWQVEGPQTKPASRPPASSATPSSGGTGAIEQPHSPATTTASVIRMAQRIFSSSGGRDGRNPAALAK